MLNPQVYEEQKTHKSEPQMPGGIPYLMTSQKWLQALFFRVDGEKVRGGHSESIKDPWRECAIQSHQDKVQDLSEGYAECVLCLCFSVYVMEMPRGHDRSQTSPHT